MKLTLERLELIGIIGKVLGYELKEDDVTVKAEPFEVHIQNVNLGGTPDPTKTDKPEEPNSYYKEEEEQSAAASLLTMGDILKHNSTMGGPKPPSIVVEEEDIPLSRNLGPLESADPPPLTSAELTARLRSR